MRGRDKTADHSAVRPAPVQSGDSYGNSIAVGDHNSPNRKVVIKQTYSGTPDKDFRFIVDDSMVSAIYVEGRGYLPDYIVGNVRPSDYWEKRMLHKAKSEVSVLSFSEIVFTIASPITYRASGGDVDATVFGDFRFRRGNPRSVSSLLQSSFAKKETEGSVERTYITAEGLEQIIRTGLQDIVRMPLFRDRVYSNLDNVSEAILELIRDSPFFTERCIESTQLDIKSERTEYEKLDDAEVNHAIGMRKMELDAEFEEKKRQLSHESAVAEQERAIRLEESRKRLMELESEIEDSRRASSIKNAEAELQKIKLSLDAEHYETDYQDNRVQRDLNEQQRREIELQKAKTDSLIKMVQAAAGTCDVPSRKANPQAICSECGNGIPTGSKFCPKCGSEQPTVVRSDKAIPEDIKTLFERMRSVVGGSDEGPQSDGSAIVMSPVVRNLPRNFKGTVAATDSITFESSKDYVLHFHYKDEKIVSAHFHEEIAFRREVKDDRQRLMFYSDYANYPIGGDAIGTSKVQAMTRQPVMIVCVGDRFFICCMKETGYLKIDNGAVDQGVMTELELGKKVSLGAYMWFVIETA